MPIRAVPLISAPIYLRDISKEILDFEPEDIPRKEQAFVLVRQATMGDDRWVAAAAPSMEVRIAPDGSRVEKWDDEISDSLTMRSYRCLVGVGNIENADGAPLFAFKEGKNYPELDMTYAEFKELFELLPAVVAATIQNAVMRLTIEWGWKPSQDEEGAEPEGEVEGQAT